MSRALTLDIGSNSIGWAEIEHDKVLRAGARIYPISNSVSRRHFTLPRISAEKAAHSALLMIALLSFCLAAFFDPQFWASVAFSALIAWLSLIKE